MTEKRDPFGLLQVKELHKSYRKAYDITVDLYYGKNVLLLGPLTNPRDVFPGIDVCAFVNWYPVYEEFFDSYRSKAVYASGRGLTEYNRAIVRREERLNKRLTKKELPQAVYSNITRDIALGTKDSALFTFPHFYTKYYPNPEWHFVSRLFEELKCSPLTGVIALEHILQACPRTVRISGWNLYNLHNSLAPKDIWNGQHNITAHAAYLKKRSSEDRRIFFGPELRKVLA